MSDNTPTLDPFDAAVLAATSELGEGNPDDDVEGNPPATQEDESTENQAPVEQDEQAEQEDTPAEAEGEDSDELFAEVEIEELPEETPEQDPGLHVLPGIDEPVSTEELRNGYLRQADYTKKTQELAAQRNDAKRADQLWSALTEHPVELARQLAVAAGLIEEGQAPVNVVELPFMSEEELQAQVDARVEEALANHPEVLEARQVAGQVWIDNEFAQIEKSYSVTLGPDSRQKVLREAYRLDTDNLELVFLKLKQVAEDRARQLEQAKKAAPRKPTGQSSVEAPTAPVSNFDDAVALAKAEMAAKGKL